MAFFQKKYVPLKPNQKSGAPPPQKKRHHRQLPPKKKTHTHTKQENTTDSSSQDGIPPNKKAKTKAKQTNTPRWHGMAGCWCRFLRRPLRMARGLRTFTPAARSPCASSCQWWTVRRLENDALLERGVCLLFEDVRGHRFFLLFLRGGALS